MKSLKITKIILLIVILVFIIFLSKYNLDLYSNVYTASSKYVNTIEGFTNVTDSDGNRLNNTDNTMIIWNIGKQGVLGIDDPNSRTYLKPVEFTTSLPPSLTWERLNIINYGSDNIVAIKSAFFKERYYYLHSDGSTRVGQGGSWEKMKFINYSVIERKRLEEEKRNEDI